MPSLYELVRTVIDERKKKRSRYKIFVRKRLAYYGVRSPEELDTMEVRLRIWNEKQENITKHKFYQELDRDWKRFKLNAQQNTGE